MKCYCWRSEVFKGYIYFDFRFLICWYNCSNPNTQTFYHRCLKLPYWTHEYWYCIWQWFCLLVEMIILFWQVLEISAIYVWNNGTLCAKIWKVLFICCFCVYFCVVTGTGKVFLERHTHIHTHTLTHTCIPVISEEILYLR